MHPSDDEPSAMPSRLRSLDALRGFDMLWITGLAGAFRAAAEASDAAWIQAWAGQLHHVPWEGLHAYDLIFPLFMFLSGMAIPYSLGAKIQRGAARSALAFSVLRRVLLLILLGAIYNGLLLFEFSSQRYASVLGQIGLSYGMAAWIFLFTRGWKPRALACLAVLLGTAALQLLVPVPGYGAGILTQEGVINAWIDRRFLPGRLHGGSFDPEGWLCILSSSALTLGGVLTGSFVRSRGASPSLATVGILLAAGASLLAAGGLCWQLGYPPVKGAWTASFSLLAGGICVWLFALFHLAVDFRPDLNWSFPLQVIGMNPLTLYLAARIIPFLTLSQFFFQGLANQFPAWSNVILYAGVLVLEWLLLLFLYQKRVFLRV